METEGLENPYHKYGHPINVLKFSEDDKIIIQNEELKEMLQHRNVKFRKIVPFSIIGAYRKGKSFFLDYCLRFLYAHYPSINCPNLKKVDNWMGEKDEQLKGFSWRSGATRDTTGIIVWSDVFLHKNEMTGEEIAIIVMDTQGLFDNLTTATGNSRIFALGTLISSIQVLNSSGVVQEDQLQYLQFATEFAKFAAADKNEVNAKPFQNLMFLIRDWVHWKDHDYGLEGGMTYLNTFLEIKANQRDELKSVRQFIKASFEELTCSLLPHPGDRVVGSKKNQSLYDGNWGEMEEEFINELKILIDHLLKPERLTLKKVNQKELQAEEYFGYLDDYFHLFQSEEIPEAKTIYEITVEKSMNTLVDLCYDRYIDNIIKSEELIETTDQIKIVHKMSRNDALLLYKKSKKMGNKNHDLKFKDNLIQKLEDYYKSWLSTSEANLKEIEEQKENTRRMLQEKHEYQLKIIDDEKAALEEMLKEMEAENKSIMEREDKLYKDKIEKERLKGENKIKKTIKDLEVEIENCKISIENAKNTTNKELYEQRHRLEEELEIIKTNDDVQLAEIGRRIDNVKISKDKEVLAMRTIEQNNRIAAEKAEQERQEALKKKMEAEIERDKFEKLYAIEASKPLWHSSTIYSGLPAPTAVLVGNDADENPVYVGQAICGDTEYPANVIPDKSICSISNSGKEYFREKYYVLCANCYTWLGSFEANVPSNALITGYTEKNEVIYVARTKHKNNWIVGRVVDNQSFILFPYKGKELMARKFDFLVRN